MWNKKKQPIPEAHAPMGAACATSHPPGFNHEEQANRALTAIERLKVIRDGKVSEMQKLAQDLAELDQVISWADRFPEVEKIIGYLRNRV